MSRREDLLTRYSNRSDLLHGLGEALRRLEHASQEEQPRLGSWIAVWPGRRSLTWGFVGVVGELGH